MQAFGADDPSFSLASRPRTVEQWSSQLSSALASKLAARRESRVARLAAQARLLRAEIAAAQSVTDSGERLLPAPHPTRALTPEERTQLAVWRRKRTFRCLVATQPATEEVAGCVALSLARPEAALPPPFPTNKQLRCYVSNMAVAEGHRRRGLAAALLQECERAARRWGEDSIWLHVDVGNDAAMALYAAAGYEEVRDGAFWGATRRRLMRKALPRRNSAEDTAYTAVTAAGGVGRVFRWRVTGGDPPGGG